MMYVNKALLCQYLMSLKEKIARRLLKKKRREKGSAFFFFPLPISSLVSWTLVKKSFSTPSTSSWQ